MFSNFSIGSKIGIKITLIKKRAKRRQTKCTAAAEEAALDGRDFLEKMAVTPKVQKTYEEELSRWCAYLASMGLSASTVAKMDSNIKSFFDLSFFDGIEPSHGEKFLAGVMDRAPEFGKMGALQLPRSWRALRAWERLTPPRSRKGKPWAVWCAVGWRLNAQGHLDMAIFLLEWVTGYYRPSELQRIRKKDWTPPSTATSSHWTLRLCPEEDMLPSKTGVFNDSVTLDSTKTKFLDPFRKALHVAGDRSRTWKFTYNQFCREFGKAAASLGLKLVPCMARHSEPSMDLASGERDLAGVRKRLRVSGLKTLDRYERAANLERE